MLVNITCLIITKLAPVAGTKKNTPPQAEERTPFHQETTSIHIVPENRIVSLSE